MSNVSDLSNALEATEKSYAIPFKDTSSDST